MPMPSNFEKVAHLVKKCDLEVYHDDADAHLIDDGLFLFRLHLIMEETVELLQAHRKGDLHQVADSIGDLLVVTYGLAHLCNMQMDDVFAEIHRCNMLKVKGTGSRGYGSDLVKPPGWTPPDLTHILKRRR